MAYRGRGVKPTSGLNMTSEKLESMARKCIRLKSSKSTFQLASESSKVSEPAEVSESSSSVMIIVSSVVVVMVVVIVQAVSFVMIVVVEVVAVSVRLLLLAVQLADLFWHLLGHLLGLLHRHLPAVLLGNVLALRMTLIKFGRKVSDLPFPWAL